jgi:hypothetical protein
MAQHRSRCEVGARRIWTRCGRRTHRWGLQNRLICLRSASAAFHWSDAEVGRLREALNEESHREEAAALIRGLIETIVLKPAADGAGKKSLTIDLTGHLAGILALGSAAKKKGANGAPLDQQIKLVAGAGIELCLLVSATGLRPGGGTASCGSKVAEIACR